MADFRRAVVAATVEWRDRRRKSLDGIKNGIDNGTFDGVETDLYADPSKAPDVSEIEESLYTAMDDPSSGASRGFSISHHSQLAFLEAECRTGVVRKISRRGALALLRSELEDGRRRDDHLETLIVFDDMPEGAPS